MYCMSGEVRSISVTFFYCCCHFSLLTSHFFEMDNVPCPSPDIAGSMPDNGVTVCTCFTRSDRKRPNESYMNPRNEADSSPNKKQAVQSPEPEPAAAAVAMPMRSSPSISSVRSLTYTGIYDGVPVKYWSSCGKELDGIIKGTGFLCGCETCKSSEVICAGKFERHAGCKTNHPNKRIYFKSRKTIYAVVQKLRSLPANELFKNIETATGSPINQKAFSAWKGLFVPPDTNLEETVTEVDKNECK